MRASRWPRKQTACTECQRRKQKCVFRADGLACIRCSKRYPPVECVMNPIGWVDDSRSRRSESAGPLQLAPWHAQREPADSHSPASDGPSRETLDRLLWRGKGELQPIANQEWLRVAAGSSKGKLVSSFGRSGTNLILDGSGDPSALRPFGGILTEINTINSLAPHHSARNVELLHFYLRYVVPNLVSIDGESQPDVFVRDILPWQLQSPVFPNIGLLMACATQSLDRGVELDQNPESLAMKARALSYINKYLSRADKSSFYLIASESIKCVVNLVVMEWFWGADESMKAHVRGIKEMVQLGGGARSFMETEPVMAGIIILTDYEIACGFESDVNWQDGNPVLEDEIPIPTTWPKGFDYPMIRSRTRFRDIADELGINARTAEILDDVRTLTTAITYPGHKKYDRAEAQAEATRLLKGLEEESWKNKDSNTDATEEDLIYETIRLAAIILYRSIKLVTLISKLPEPSIKDLESLYTTMNKVSLKRWKRTPAIFLWFMLVLCPSCRSDRKGGFVRRKMAVAGLSMGFEHFSLSISALRAFWLVQRWIVANQR